MASLRKTFVLRRMNFFHVFLLFVVWNGAFASGQSEEITDDNWDAVLHGHWMIKFYAPWCPACRNLEPTWEKFALEAESLNVRVGEVDVTRSTALSGRFGIVSLPTIYHAMNGKFRLYQEKRKLDELLDFVKDKKWEKVEPVPSWKSPSSILMSGLGMVFKASVVFKNIHTTLTETYGLPAWGSYVLFGVGTVLIGLILGVVLVFLSDLLLGVVSPSAPRPPGDTSESGDADDEAGADDGKPEINQENTSQDDEAENEAEDSTNVRKRTKKLKATTG
ncbi:thioredoxin-related transmembrane protein 1-like [Dendronephthya gigantea]|uniref:thioredoxin-related transmembrane protein 1-like n=1 Tax=Dendronephthya gigantea TaxID=151771 RepID=UPI00106B1561|nr:thioredoxin-related transmembrane protein 1-like [Dendronephthya gigantea]